MDWQKKITEIQPLDRAAMEASRRYWNTLGKPLYSLGQLETVITQIAGITGDPAVTLERRCVYVLCADNGVVAEGVTQTDNSVTAIVAENIAAGAGNVNAMARAAKADVFPVDIGMCRDVEAAGLLQKKIAYGTENFAKAPAMTRAQAIAAIAVGVELAAAAKGKGYQAIATGEMGIGNTSTSSAMLSVLLGLQPELAVGRGAGLSDAGLQRKRQVIADAIALHQPDAQDPLDVLSKLGGYDIAGMTGLFLGGAIYRIPIVIDGLISAAAALTASRICPLARDFMLASHLSREPAAKAVFAELGMEPMLHCGMALGEGTGAVSLFPLLDQALAVYQQDTTFAKIHMEPYADFSGGSSC